MADMDQASGDELDRDDPLLITTVRARLKREEKVKRVGRKTVKRLVNVRGGDEEKAGEKEEQPSMVNPRRYQEEAFKEALRKNIILYLETGGGKTLVAVLLIKALAKNTRLETDKRVIVFLAPTVLLVQQQARVVKIHTDLKVGEYYGARGVDNWSNTEWDNQISDVEVMMMTPQVLLNNLQHGFMKMDRIELLIFDECHHAHRNHAYAQIMKGFYHVNTENGRLPKIFGMTASPATKKGMNTPAAAAGQLSGLEDVLKSEVFTLKDRNEVEFVAPTASTIEQLYDAPNPEIIAPYKEKIEALLAKYEKANLETLANVKVGFKDQAELIEKLTIRIKKHHRDLQFCLEELGLWCAYKAAEHTFKVDTGVNDPEGFGDATRAFKRNKDLFLTDSLHILQSTVPEGWNTAPTAQELQDAVSKGYLTPKVYQSKKDVRCITFVERRMTAVVLARLVNHLQCLSEFLQAESICGASAGVDTTRVQQQSTVAKFNQGEINLLVATDIAEEGIDVQTCSEVIRFSLPKTVRSNIQSRGRARRQGSTYIVFLERGNMVQKEQFSKIVQSEPVMKEEVISRENMPVNNTLVVGLPPQNYRVPSTGASVTTDTSVNLILRFCTKLPGDKFYNPKPEFLFRKVGSQHICDLKLPHPSPINEVKGQLQSTSQLAKQVTALEACRQLHELRALNDNLVPSLDYELGDEEEKIFTTLRKTSGFGTTQQKELYPVEEAKALTGDWLTSDRDVCLYAYRMSFDVQPVEDEVYANFVLLTGSALEDDVASLGIDLCLTRGRKVTAKLSSLGITTVTARQLDNAKMFQQVLFDGMFSKMTKSAQEGKKRKRGPGFSSLFIDGNDLWKPNNAYLLLPAALKETIDFGTSIPIDWKSIETTSSAVKNFVQNEEQAFENAQPRKKTQKVSIFKSFTRLFCPPQEKSLENCLTSAGNRQDPYSQRQEKSLNFADRQLPISQVADVAVLTYHTKMIYAVITVLDGMTAQTQFSGGKDSEYKSYEDFFKKKHGITLQYPNQPLLKLKQNHRAHNLLPTDAGTSGGPTDARKSRKFQKEKPEKRNGADNVDRAPNEVKNPLLIVAEVVVPKASAQSTSVEMPAELCLVLGFGSAVIRSAYWVPSVMHRIKAAVLASQLRRLIHAPTIPVMEVLKALTTTRCNENFNMEALELFGDSFLKYAVSRKLFLELKTVNEGVLSTRRMHRICNVALHQLAVKRGLPGYIRDCQFDPSRWVAPGMLVSKEVVCRCKVEKQMFKPFKSTTSKVIGVFGNEILTDTLRTETIKPKIGLTCDKGHRYLCSKTVADVMEALIGAYLVGRNVNYDPEEGALEFMKWAGIDVDYNPHLMKAASQESPVDLSRDYGMDVKALEKRIGYTFRNKYLLLEAMTHASNMGGDRIRCYQRLEFLGDAVLDFLLTRHLFTSHPTSTPGLLTSLRSASVNNERFARVVIKNKLHCYLRHGSGLLLHQIEKFAESFEAADDDQKNSSFGLNGFEAPKVLGDMVESIAGAVLVDTCFNLDKVWTVMKPLLEPIVTPATLDLHPVTDLEELCARKGYNLNFYDQHSKDARISTVRYEVQINDEVSIDGISCQPKKKTAKKDAAWKVLSKLKTHGFKEKFGKKINHSKLSTSEELVNLQIAETSQIRPEKTTGVTSDIPATRDNESDDDNQTRECGEKLGKETCSMQQKLEPSEALASIRCADMLRTFPDEKSKPSSSSTIDNESDEGLQDKQVNVVTMSKVGLIIETNAEDFINTTKIKSSSLLSKSCTTLTISENECHSKVDDRSENGYVQEGVKKGVEVTRQGKGEDSTEQLADVSKILQDKVSEDVELPVLPKVEALTGGEEFSRDAALKREFVPEDDDRKASSKLSKFHWSQDVFVRNVGITSSSSTEQHAKKHNFVKPTDGAIDLLSLCPWTEVFSSESFVCEVQGKSTTIKSSEGAVGVLQGNGFLSSLEQSSSKSFSEKTSKLSMSSITQGAKSSCKAAKNTPPKNCREILNNLSMKNKWSTSLAYKLMNEESMSQFPRFRFSLTVDTGNPERPGVTYESQGEAKADKKQGQESAAAAMLVILKKNGFASTELP